MSDGKLVVAKRRISRGPDREAAFLAVFLVVAAILFSTVKMETDGIARRQAPGSSIIYIPSGKFLKFATFGFPDAAADLIYIWSIQYYGTPTIDDRFTHLEHIYGIIGDLDPLYSDPVEVGAMIAVEDAHDPKMALRVLDAGMAKNPANWVLPFNAGHVAMMYLKDFDLAEKYFTRCMAISGSPDFVPRLRANAIFRKGDVKTAWDTWLDIYNTARDERTRKIASNHLYNIKQTIDTGRLSEAVGRYKEKYGRLPESLDRLAAAGLIEAIPKDLDGKDYLYDPRTGEVKAPILPWKR